MAKKRRLLFPEKDNKAKKAMERIRKELGEDLTTSALPRTPWFICPAEKPQHQD